MRTSKRRLLYIMIAFIFGHLLIGATPLAAQVDCQMILQAARKVFDVPTHMYVTGKIDGQTFPAEMIYAEGTVYMKANGKWSPAGTTKDMAKLMAEKEQKSHDGKATCRYLKDEPVSGDMAAVYSMHAETPKAVVNSQIWISKAKGLPLRQEDDMEKMHNSTRYEYGNVKPPM